MTSPFIHVNQVELSNKHESDHHHVVIIKSPDLYAQQEVMSVGIVIQIEFL